MKDIKQFIIEKFKINSKNAKQKYLDPEEIEGPETPGKDYWDEDVIIIGWPFQKEGDENYNKTKEYIEKHHYRINNDFGDIDDPEFFDWFCYAMKDNEIDCYIYGTEGVIALNKKYE